MGNVVALAGSRPAVSARPPFSLSMRLALGLLHAGPLFMTGPRRADASFGQWRSRHQPDAVVIDQTMVALERRGYASLRDYDADGARRWCAQLTPAGAAAYRDAGGHASGAPRLAPDDEFALERLDDALAQAARELEKLAGVAAGIGPRMQAARAEIDAALRDTARTTSRIAELTRLTGSLTGRRDAIRARLLKGRLHG